jgi:TrmH family RNA methyltransferase
LLRRAQRRQENAFLVEGNRAVLDVLESGATIEELFVVEELAEAAAAVQSRAAGIPVHVVGWAIAKAITDSVTPQGIVAVAASPLRPLAAIEARAGLVVVIAGVSDPGNVGTLVRSAAAAGSDGVILTEGTSDALNPKTARASAAALFSVPLVADVTLSEAVAHLRASGFMIAGTDARSATTIYDSDLTRPVALVLGNESWGLSPEDAALVDHAMSIPMPGAVESLNVAVAGSIVIFEVLRQRREPRATRLSSTDPEEATD